MSSIKETENLLELLREKKTELDRCQGELDAVLKEFKKTYKTDNIDKLKKIQENMESELLEAEMAIKEKLKSFYTEIEDNGIL